jgi:hypothetical protein
MGGDVVAMLKHATFNDFNRVRDLSLGAALNWVLINGPLSARQNVGPVYQDDSKRLISKRKIGCIII